MTSDPALTTQALKLSAESAFVVHLASTPSDAPETIHGRIEHVITGRSMRFASSAELIGFMQGIRKQLSVATILLACLAVTSAAAA